MRERYCFRNNIGRKRKGTQMVLQHLKDGSAPFAAFNLATFLGKTHHHSDIVRNLQLRLQLDQTHVVEGGFVAVLLREMGPILASPAPFRNQR